jgi:hypothetical protein
VKLVLLCNHDGRETSIIAASPATIIIALCVTAIAEMLATNDKPAAPCQTRELFSQTAFSAEERLLPP